ncbi:MAG: aspartate kinase [Rubrobacter sp.]|nr:aspartate kinase [Rubrobacter sp.]
MKKNPLVIKFGGTSVGGGKAFVRAANIAADEAMSRPVSVVVSAMSGVTDTLLGHVGAAKAAGRMNGSTNETHEDSLAALHDSLYARHLAAAREAVSEEYLDGVEARILGHLGRLAERMNDPEASDAARAAEVATHGERLSAEILAAAIRSLGVESAVARDPIAVESEANTEAEICPDTTRERCSRNVAPILDGGSVAVVPGYVGRTPSGKVTTLGRGGSDLSATALGRGIGASEVWIMTDVDGVMSADPRLVPDAALMPKLSYREARIFAELGAKVLHHKTMEPASEAGIEVRVGNTFNPECDGTLVSDIEDGEGVRCVALRRSLRFEVPCANGRKSEAAMVVGIGVPGSDDLAAGRQSLRKAKIPVLHFGNAPAGLVFSVSEEYAEAALRTLHDSLVGRSLAGEAVA